MITEQDIYDLIKRKAKPEDVEEINNYIKKKLEEFKRKLNENV